MRNLTAVVLAGLLTTSCGFVDDREATTAQGPTTTAQTGASTGADGTPGSGSLVPEGTTGSKFDLSATSGLPAGWRATTGPTFPLPEDGEGLQPAPGDGPVPDPIEGLCPTLGPLNDMIGAITAGTDPVAAKFRVADLASSLTVGGSDPASAALISDVRAFLVEANAAMTDQTNPERLRAQFMEVAISNAPLVIEYIDAVIGCEGAPVAEMREIQSGLQVQQQLPRSGSPVGRVDTLAVTDGRLDLWGWATDPDALGPVTIQVGIDGEVFDATTTQEVGPFGDLTLPGFVQGFFSWSRPLSPGPHRICVRVVNVGPGNDSVLGCRTTA